MSNRKDERKFAAQKHICEMNSLYYREIDGSIATAGLYASGRASRLKLPAARRESTEVVLMETDSVSALMECDGSACVLSFASYKNPGGGYENGSWAQEEALCGESSLYPVLLSFLSSFYLPNRSNTNKGLYTDKAIYASDIVFKRGERVVLADVLSMSAPNKGVALRNGVSEGVCDSEMRRRVGAALNIAATRGTDTFIGGAYGCGVFKNDPDLVARAFLEWVDENPGVIPKLVLAVPGGGANYEAFKNAMDERAAKRGSPLVGAGESH